MIEMTSDYDRWLMRDPEDDLPPWVYDLEDCPKCGDVLTDTIPLYEDTECIWDGDVCKCGEEE